MIDPYQCEEPIRCLFDGCYELAEIQHEYCSQPTSYPVSYHIPVDTLGVSPWSLMGIAIMFVGIIFLIVGHGKKTD